MLSLDLAGQIFGKLRVSLFAGKAKNGISLYECVCDCGNRKVIRSDSLKSGRTRSCGCLAKSKGSRIHGRSRTTEYYCWAHIVERCTKTNHPQYNNYGGRGISVCDRWRDSFENFYADMGPRPSTKHSIDRINNDGNYEPSNCRWATRTIQILNRRKIKSESGITGVYFDKRKNRWYSRITVNYKPIYLGMVATKEEAIAARKKAELKYHSPLLGN